MRPFYLFYKFQLIGYVLVDDGRERKREIGRKVLHTTTTIFREKETHG